MNKEQKENGKGENNAIVTTTSDIGVVLIKENKIMDDLLVTLKSTIEKVELNKEFVTQANTINDLGKTMLGIQQQKVAIAREVNKYYENQKNTNPASGDSK